MRGPTFDHETMRSAIKAIALFHASTILAEKRLGKTFYSMYPDFFKEMIFTGDGKMNDWCIAGIEAAKVVANSLGLKATNFHELYERVLKDVKNDEVCIIFYCVCHVGYKI